jgi:hypothetical protein
MSSGSSSSSEVKNSNRDKLIWGCVIGGGCIVIGVILYFVISAVQNKNDTEDVNNVGGSTETGTGVTTPSPVPVVNKNNTGSANAAATKPSTTGAPSAATTPPPSIPVASPWSTFAIGQSINCKSDDPNGKNTGGVNGGGSTIYRYMGNNTANAYPSNIIASSWDSSNWNKPKTITCSGLKQGVNMSIASGSASETVVSPKYIGCYKDDYVYSGGRLLNKGGGQINTVQGCNAAAAAAGAPYFGMQYWRGAGESVSNKAQCWWPDPADKNLTLTKITSLGGGTCDVGTDGNIYGQGMMNAIYTTNPNMANFSTPTYIGCYKDEGTAYSGGRLMSKGEGSIHPVIACNNAAKAGGAPYFGMQYWRGAGESVSNKAQCWWANPGDTNLNFNKITSLGGGSCDVGTDGNIYGQGMMNAIYQVV